MSELTYPTLVGHRIVECTQAQREALERRTMTLEERICQLYVAIDELQQRIEVLEQQQS